MTHTSTYRMKGLATIAEFLAQMRQEIAERTDRWLRDVLKPDEAMPNVAFLLELVERKCEQGREQLDRPAGDVHRRDLTAPVAGLVRVVGQEVLISSSSPITA